MKSLRQSNQNFYFKKIQFQQSLVLHTCHSSIIQNSRVLLNSFFREEDPEENPSSCQETVPVVSNH